MAASYQPAREIIIESARAGQRLDNFLFARFRNLPKSRIYKMLRKGEVRVNGSRTKQGYRIQAGDRVRLPPVRLEAAGNDTVKIPHASARQLEASILHEDDMLIVIAKPAGLAVHSGSGIPFGVIEILRHIRPNAPFLELAHRLDRDTSGCLLVACNRDALTTLHDLLKSGGIEKYYLALVSGQWRGGKRRITQSLARSGPAGKVRLTGVDPEGKRAVSEFEPLRQYADATLIRVRIHTGRTHQIRVHAAEAGHPLIGDSKYGDFACNREWRKLGLRRLFLHAAEIAFQWPRSGRKMRFTAPLPTELQQTLDRLNEQ